MLQSTDLNFIVPLAVLGHLDFLLLLAVLAEVPVQMLTVLGGGLVRHAEARAAGRALDALVQTLDHPLVEPAEHNVH